MSRALSISDELFSRLENAARRLGLPDVERLLEKWNQDQEERERRSQTVQQIDALRATLYATYGEMPDSVELIRQDRDR